MLAVQNVNVPLQFPLYDRDSPQAGPSQLPRAVQALRSRHSRPRSVSSAPSTAHEKSSNINRASSLRSRASSTSTSELPFHKPNYMHTVSLSGTSALRAQPILSIERETEETIGSFSPTSCPRRHLHEILEASKPQSRIRFNSLTGFGTRSSKLHRSIDASIRGERTRTDSPPDSDDDQSHTSSSSSIPSICRTPSSYSESEYFPPPLVAPAHSPSGSSSPDLRHHHHHQKALRPAPILEALEDASKFRVRTACAHCKTVGSNFPCCPRCGEMWCSRECRVRATGGKRHVCRKD